jgi:hypothetical protein
MISVRSPFNVGRELEVRTLSGLLSLIIGKVSEHCVRRSAICTLVCIVGNQPGAHTTT